MKNKKLLSVLNKMLLIRIIEEQIARIAENKEIQCPIHLYAGQEAIAASVCEALNQEDFVYSMHRSHGHYLAKGGDPDKLILEIYCRENGCSRGRGGSMHLIDRSVNFMASTAIVAGTIPLAVGSALSAKIRNSKQVSVAFFGDGATDEGIFYESLNFAALHNLPMIFVCENNGFATHLPGFLRQSNPSISDRIRGFKINTTKVDGNNPLEILTVITDMVNSARNKKGPSLIECDTYRWYAHVSYMKDLDVGYRKKKDVEAWMKRCPIKFLSEKLISEKIISETDYIKMQDDTLRKVKTSIDEARKSPVPDPATLSRDLFYEK